MWALRPTNAAVRTMSAADRLHVDKNLVNFSGNCVTIGGRFVTIFVSLRNIKSYRIMAKVKKIFPVLQMGGAACAARVENAVKETPGGVSAAVNFASANLSVEYDSAVVSPEGLREAVRRAGYDLLVEDEGVSPDALDDIQKKK